MEIYIIRHGETDGNKAGIFQGWLDLPLNENGKLLAKLTGQALAKENIKFDVCFCSPLIRARQTADILLQSSNNENCEVIIDERIKEISNGDLEGKKIKGSETESLEHQRMVDMWMNDSFAMGRFPNGESAQDVCDRTQVFLFELAKKDYKKVLVSTHGAALRAMLNFLYEDKKDFWHGVIPYNCVINIVEVKDGNISLIADDKVYYDSKYIVDNYKEEK